MFLLIIPSIFWPLQIMIHPYITDVTPHSAPVKAFGFDIKQLGGNDQKIRHLIFRNPGLLFK